MGTVCYPRAVVLECPRGEQFEYEKIAYLHFVCVGV